MFSKFKSDTEVLFLDPDLDIEPKKERVSVVLSPALYWVRSFSLPVRSQKEAKKLLPSLFEEFLPEGEFSYFGYFEGDRYLGFAYEEAKIRSLLVQKGIDLGSVLELHFAQSELSEEMLPVRIGREWMLASVDGIVLKLPLQDAIETKPLDVTAIELSPRSVTIERYASPIEKKTLYTLCAIFLSFALLYALEYFRVDAAFVQLQKRSENLFKHYSLLPTMTQNRSVLKRYEKIDAKQKRVRKVVAAMLKTPQYAGGHLVKLDVEKKSVRAVFSGVENMQRLKKRLLPLKAQISKLKKGAISVEVAL